MAVHALRALQGQVYLCEVYADKIKLGSREEDGEGIDTSLLADPCRTQHHGYNPITGVTGGVFTCEVDAACTSGSPTTARARARVLWNAMDAAFQAGNFDGGDGVGAYHYLGRVLHMLQDMTSFVHVHPGAESGTCAAAVTLEPSIEALEHKDFEDEEENHVEDPTSKLYCADWDCSSWLSPLGPVYPTDPLPAVATEKLDDFSRERLESASFTSDEVEDFVDAVARVTYFRGTFWGQVTFGQHSGTSASGPATSGMTDEVDFDDGTHVLSHPNTLQTMFGAGSVSWHYNLIGDDYYEIVDKANHTHRWSETLGVDEEWFPCNGDTPDGHVLKGGSDPMAEGVRTIGRFFFANAYDGPNSTSDPVVPRYYPDGSAFGMKNLGEYISYYAMSAGVGYSAGLIMAALVAEGKAGGKAQGGTVKSSHQIAEGTYEIPAESATAVDFENYNIDADIKAWEVGVSNFANVNGTLQSNNRAVDVHGSNGSTRNNECVRIEATHWLDAWNSMGFRTFNWSTARQTPNIVSSAAISAALPDHRWVVSQPTLVGNDVVHVVRFINDDPVNSLKITGLQVRAMVRKFANLADVDFAWAGINLPVLPPGGQWSMNVYTPQWSRDRFIYLKYDVYDPSGTTVACHAWGAHEIPATAGGCDKYTPMELTRGIDEDNGYPQGNYPNPFNPETTIPYHVPVQDRVRLDIFDVHGRHIRTLVDEVQAPGAYETRWDGRNDIGEQVASGVYFYRVATGRSTRMGKMMLIK